MRSVLNICQQSYVKGGIFGQSDNQCLSCWKGKAERYFCLQRGPTIISHFLFFTAIRNSSLTRTRQIKTEQNKIRV